MYCSDAFGKTELQESVCGIENMGTPIAEGPVAIVIPAAPVTGMQILAVGMFRGRAEPGVPVDALGCGRPEFLLLFWCTGDIGKQALLLAELLLGSKFN